MQASPVLRGPRTFLLSGSEHRTGQLTLAVVQCYFIAGPPFTSTLSAPWPSLVDEIWRLNTSDCDALNVSCLQCGFMSMRQNYTFWKMPGPVCNKWNDLRYADVAFHWTFRKCVSTMKLCNDAEVLINLIPFLCSYQPFTNWMVPVIWS